MSIEKAVVSMLCLTAIELMALYQGIDGQLLSIMVAAIAGLGGYGLAKATQTNGSTT